MGQAQESSIKIRTLPRGEEIKKELAAVPQSELNASSKWVVLAGACAVFVLLATILAPGVKSKNAQPQVAKIVKPVEMKDLSSQSVLPQPERTYDSVNKHLEDTALRHEMMVQLRKMENMKVQTDDLGADLTAADEEIVNFGVQLDQDSSAERVFEDLNEDLPTGFTAETPGDKISSRLANRRWVNEAERAERIQFVRNFIRTWAERGYEVQINQDLVVVGYRKVSKPITKVSIDQVIERMARQGL